MKKKKQKIRVALTGSRGFLGINFVRFLKAKRIEIIEINGDVRDYRSWNIKFDVLFHFATRMMGTQNISKDEMFDINVGGTHNALKACCENNALLVFTSTAGVYRSKSNGPIKETDPVYPLNHYSASKLVAEQMCQKFSNQNKVRSIIFRIFNLYGVGQRKDFLVPYIVSQFLNKEKIKLKEPLSVRDFIYINDMVFLLYKAIECPVKFGIFNAGTGEPVSIIKVVEVLEEITKQKIRYDASPKRNAFQSEFYADMARTNRQFKWKATIGIKEGLQMLLNAESK